MIKVVKFGGSSLASAEQFAKVGKIIHADKERRYVVPSAPGKRNSKDTKVTDMLYACYDLVEKDEDFHVMLMKKLSDSPADVMENLSFGLSVDHVLAVTVSGLLGAVWKFVGPEWVFVLGAAVCLVHFGVAVWLGKRAN